MIKKYCTTKIVKVQSIRAKPATWQHCLIPLGIEQIQGHTKTDTRDVTTPLAKPGPAVGFLNLGN